LTQLRLILLVEDNPDDELLTLDALRTSGTPCEIAVTRDGAEALDFLLSKGAYAGRDPRADPCMVLLDLKLPKLSGFDVLEHIRANERTRLMPVVLLTSSSQDEDMVRGYASGANSVIRKPVKFDHFVEAMRSIGRYWLTVNQVPSH
jgi:two-component system, response regulator